MRVENRIEKIYSLSPLQEGILLHSLLDESSQNYFNQLQFRYGNSLQIEIFEKSINNLIKMHETLRTVFINEGIKEPRQVVLGERKLKLFFKDLKDLDKAGQKAYLTEFEEKDRQRGFDLSRDLLLRFSLFRLDKQEYIIYLSFHHIIMDGWSIPLLLNELFTRYKKMLNRDSPAIEESASYSDYIRWLGRRDRKRALQYWNNYLSGFKSITSVPSTSHINKHCGRREYSFCIDKEITKKMVNLTMNNHITFNIFFQSLWAILLKYFNNSNDIIFGTVVSCRNPEFQGSDSIIGLMINTIPVRIQIDPDFTFIQLLKQVQKRALEVENFKYASLSEIQTQTGFKEGLFDHLFVFENYPLKAHLNGNDSIFSCINGFKMFETTNYDFNILVVPEEKLKIQFIYNENRIPHEHITLIQTYLNNLIQQVLDNEATRIKDIKLVPDSLLFNAAASSRINYNQNIIRIFEEKVSKEPHNVCLIYKDKRITYEELNARANQLARTLIKGGVKPKETVGILVGRSFEMIIGILAILKAGAVYLPLNPTYPEERIRYILKDSQCRCLLVQDNYEKDFSFNGLKINLNDNRYYQEEESNLHLSLRPDDLIYITYTSGSTGKPKGVMIEHRGVVNILTALNRIYPFEKNDAYLLKTAYTFDVSIVELFGWFFGNGVLAILEQEYEKDPMKIIEAVHHYKVTHINFVPSMLSALLDTLDQDKVKALSTLKYIFAAGEALTSDIIKKMHHLGCKVQIENLYGPTEATIYTTGYSINNSDFPVRIPIGKPLDNIKCYIVNSDNRAVPAGCLGELCFSGVCLARGYYNRPELTEEKFNRKIFDRDERIYRTGDIARLLPDGNIDFLGRMDDQVKVRGNRIELGEITSALLEHPDVKEACVMARPDKNGFKYLGAYFTGYNRIEAKALKEYLQNCLPSYMMPDFFMQIEQMPLNTNGKIDRKKLPEPQSINKKHEYVAPRNEIEEDIMEIWRDVLGVERLSVYDNFFDFGGNSIKAIQVYSRLKTKYEVKISDLFEHENISELAKYIHKNRELFHEMADSLKTVTLDRIAYLSTLDYEKSVKKYEAQYNVYKELNLIETFEYKNILLTGATGYLGIHILHDLFHTTDTHITLIIRGHSEEEATERIQRKYWFYFSKDLLNAYSNRITILKGDLSKDSFGLDRTVYKELAGTIDCIINSAANVKHYGRLKDFESINIEAVEKLIDFANDKIKKIIHHISTVSIGLAGLVNKNFYLFTEFDRITESKIDNPYLKTKIAAEKILFSAQQNDLVTNIYRVGNIVFNTDTKKFQDNIGDNAFYKSIKSYIKLKKLPEIKYKTYDFTFVNYTSKAITLLFNKKELMNEVFHLTNPNYISLYIIGDLIQKCGYDLEILPFDKFKLFLSHYDHNKSEKQFILNLLLHAHFLDNPHLSGFIHKNVKTNLLLTKMGFEWKKVNQSVIQDMLNYCKSVHFL